MANGSDFPFSIMDVADLLRLNIRRRGGSRVVYADCPICGDRRGKLGLYPEINTWRCYHCGEHGGMLALYGTVHGVSNSDAYREICAALEVGAPGREYIPTVKKAPVREADQPQRASPQDIHRTLTALLAMLTLSPAHREHLRTKRGLTDEQIARTNMSIRICAATPLTRSWRRSISVSLNKRRPTGAASMSEPVMACLLHVADNITALKTF